ncbi:MAG TPA: heme o synthase [Candidatus Limnocylindrales bacterium]|nr:heme o synthase [Candidatus Limnocylindrales bacterium]
MRSASTPLRASRSAAVDRSQVYLELTKPRITLMVLLTVAVGFFAAHAANAPLMLVHVLIGTALSCSGSGALNQYLERETDESMDRTRFRPLPARRVSATAAMALGAALSIGGVVYLAVTVNLLSAVLNAVTVATYLFVYTPMKRLTPLSTLAGAVPGALPPVIGWTAATGEIGAGAAVLFAILFLWQIPHFLAIGWMYRDDYARGGFPMLVVVDGSGDATARQMVVYSLALIPVSLLLTAAGAAGSFYFWCALAAGLFYFRASLVAARERTATAARRLLLCSVIYQPALFAALFVERAWWSVAR